MKEKTLQPSRIVRPPISPRSKTSGGAPTRLPSIIHHCCTARVPCALARMRLRSTDERHEIHTADDSRQSVEPRSGLPMLAGRRVEGGGGFWRGAGLAGPRLSQGVRGQSASSAMMRSRTRAAPQPPPPPPLSPRPSPTRMLLIVRRTAGLQVTRCRLPGGSISKQCRGTRPQATAARFAVDRLAPGRTPWRVDIATVALA